MKLPGGEAIHRTGDAQCESCDAGWPQQHSEVADHCCPGFIHAEIRETGVVYYCDVCDEDDPF